MQGWCLLLKAEVDLKDVGGDQATSARASIDTSAQARSSFQETQLDPTQSSAEIWQGSLLENLDVSFLR